MRLLNVFYPGVDRFPLVFPSPLLQELEELVDYHEIPRPAGRAGQDPAYLRELYQADILLTGWGTPMLPEDLVRRGNVKYLCHVSGSVRGQIPRALLEQGLLVSNWGTSISRTIAEATLMMILACLRRVRPVQEELHHRGGYRGVPQSNSLFERRVGLIGFGAIARELVPLLRPFEVHIAAYDPYVSDEHFARMGVERKPDVRSVFSTCDIISLHAARTRETAGLVNRETLRLLPDNGVLVNSARGALIDEADLAAELQSGRLWAALDVYEHEPLPPNSPLRGLERLLLFPHQAGPTPDRLVDMGKTAVANIRRFLAGEEPVGKVTVQQYDIMT